MNRWLSVWHVGVHPNVVFTENGRYVFLVTVFVFLTTLIIPAFGILASLITLLTVAVCIGFFYRPDVRIQSHHPPCMIAGVPFDWRFTITNVGSRSAYAVTVFLEAYQQDFLCDQRRKSIVHLKPGQSEEVFFRVHPRRRGRYQRPGPSCWSTFPFDLLRFRNRSGPRLDLLVLPRFRLANCSEGSVPGRSHLPYSYSGIHPGGGVEYIGNRPYQFGDSPRWIDARAWARLAQPAVKEFVQGAQGREGIVFEISTWPSNGDPYTGADNDFETAVSVCASLAYSLDSEARLILFTMQDCWIRSNPNVREGLFPQIHKKLAEVWPVDRKRCFEHKRIRALAEGLSVLWWVGSSQAIEALKPVIQSSSNIRALVIHGQDDPPDFEGLPIRSIRTDGFFSRREIVL